MNKKRVSIMRTLFLGVEKKKKMVKLLPAQNRKQELL